jgi:acetyl esterase
VLDPELADLVASSAGRPPLSQTDITAARAAQRRAAEQAGPGPMTIKTRDIVIPVDHGPVRARLYRPPAPAGLAVWFHGGGWAIGGLEPSDRTMRYLAEESGMDVLHVDYRLAPEHRFPAAVQDACAALGWAVSQSDSHGLLKDRVVVGGESAGGNLAAVAALHARDHGWPVHLQALVYPAVDARQRSASLTEFADGYVVSAADVKWSWEHYGVGDLASPDDWRVSPIAADPTGVAPAVIICAELDPTRDDGARYAEHLRRAGVAAQYSCYPGTVHTFFGLRGRSAAAAAAHSEIASAMRAAVRAETPRTAAG